MNADYKNWVPKGMIYGFGAAAAGLAGAAVGQIWLVTWSGTLAWRSGAKQKQSTN